jgi:hypothetical protein
VSLAFALKVRAVVAPFSRISELLRACLSSAMSCTISSPLTMVIRTVSPVTAHSVGLRMPSMSPPCPRYPSMVDTSVYSRSIDPGGRAAVVVWPARWPPAPARRISRRTKRAASSVVWAMALFRR